MTRPVEPYIPSAIIPAQGSSEAKLHALLQDLVEENPAPAPGVSHKGTAVLMTFGELWALVGGPLITGAIPCIEPETTIFIRAYRDKKALTRAKVRRRSFPNTIFINLAHVQDATLAAKLRIEYREAADGVAMRNECPAALRLPFEIYRSLDGFCGATTTLSQTLLEELLHLIAGRLDISKITVLRGLIKDEAVLPALKPILGLSLKAIKDARDKEKYETPLERFERRIRYLFEDWEMTARFAKLCAALGHVPSGRTDIGKLIRDVPLLTKGVRAVPISLWKSGGIVNDHYFRPLAELNAALLMAYPEGASDYALHGALPYHFGMVRLLHGDPDGMARMDFRPKPCTVVGRNTGAPIRTRIKWVQVRKKGPPPAPTG